MNTPLVAMILLGILSLLVVLTTSQGPSMWDRLLGLSLLSAKINACIALLAVAMQRSYYLDIALVFAVLGFAGNILLARFVQRRVLNDPDDTK